MKQKRLARLLILMLLMSGAMMAGLTTESSANAVDELTIKVGYYGWSPSDYVEKAVFSAGELYDMGPGESDYTYWDGSNRVAIDSSYGVPLSTILDAAGIDQSSIANLDFWTADSGSGAFTSFTWQQLLGTKRYYFRDLAACFYYDEEGNLQCDTDAAWDGARRVQPMMALEETWVWYELGTSDATGTDTLGTANRFRLNFGQASPTERRTFNSAKMVHTIYVMFSGTPKLTSDETNIKGKVGSEHQLKVTAAAADEALEEIVQGSIVWYSSNPDIVSVDENGVLSFNKEGTATIYASGGGSEKEFKITVGGEEEEEKPEDTAEPEEPEEEKASDDKKAKGGNGKGNGNGNGNGNGKDKASGQGTDKNKSGNNTSKTQPTEKVKIKKTSNTFVLSDEASNNLRLALNRQASADEAAMSTHQAEMDKDAEQLEIKEEKNGLAGAMGMTGGILMAEGTIFGFLRFRKQRWG